MKKLEKDEDRIVLYLIVMFVLLLIIGFWCSLNSNNYKNYYTKNSSGDVNNIQNVDNNLANNSQNLSVVNTEKLIQNSTSSYLVSITEYPKENTVIKNWILSKEKDFASSSFADYNLMTSQPNPVKTKEEYNTYNWNAIYNLYTSNNYITYLYQIYSFTGGAHGQEAFEPYVINKSTGQRLNSLTDMYKSNIYTFLQDYARKDLKKQFLNREGLKEMYDYEGFVKSGTEAKAENYKAFWFDGDNLIVHFAQYQVAPYAAGQFDVTIPLSEIEKYKI